MSAFDKVIGYEGIKKELLQICDMFHNREIYEEMGADLPNGVLLYGEPGLGKTLMAKCFIEESGLKDFTIRRNKANDDFINDLTDTFQKAKEAAPCIIFLDDMDKFSNDEGGYGDTEEYVAVQSGIDEIKNSNVFIIATVNNKDKLPRSLLRSGRFDRQIEVLIPNEQDAEKIIEYYLSDKKVSESVNMEDLAKMIRYGSCAELESILNDATIHATYRRKHAIEMDDLVEVVLRRMYTAPQNDTKIPEEKLKKTALHEAGHLVVSEVLCSGSVGLASLRSTEEDIGGFIHRCKELSQETHRILISLAGKAAVELYYSDPYTDGCESDIEKAVKTMEQGFLGNCAFGFGLLNTNMNFIFDLSGDRKVGIIAAELERYLRVAKEILLKNRDFLEKAAAALMEKETLLYSDVQALRASTTITTITI